MFTNIKEKILNKWFKNTLYIRFNPNWMSVRLIEKNLSFDGKPVIAIKLDNKGEIIVAGVAGEAEKLYAEDSQNILLLNGFEHPRSFFRDIALSGRTILHFFLSSLNKKLGEVHFINLITIIHPLEKIEGGITESEFQSLIRLAEFYIGSRKTYVWTGRELNDSELLNLDFPTDNSGKLGWCDSDFDKELISEILKSDT